MRIKRKDFKSVRRTRTYMLDSVCKTNQAASLLITNILKFLLLLKLNLTLIGNIENYFRVFSCSGEYSMRSLSYPVVKPYLFGLVDKNCIRFEIRVNETLNFFTHLLEG